MRKQNFQSDEDQQTTRLEAYNFLNFEPSFQNIRGWFKKRVTTGIMKKTGSQIITTAKD